MLDEPERRKFRSLAATLNYMKLGQVRCARRREGNMHEDYESDTRELEETEEGSQISEASRTSDVGDAGMGTRGDEG